MLNKEIQNEADEAESFHQGNLHSDYRATRTEVAQYFGYPTKRKLELLAYEGKGPPMTKIGSRCLYRIGDVEKWLKSHEEGMSNAES